MQMEERIEEVTTITSDDDELRDNDALEFGCTRASFPEYGIDIVDREYLDFHFECHLYVYLKNLYAESSYICKIPCIVQ